jgi:hypothetical protein
MYKTMKPSTSWETPAQLEFIAQLPSAKRPANCLLDKPTRNACNKYNIQHQPIREPINPRINHEE